MKTLVLSMMLSAIVLANALGNPRKKRTEVVAPVSVEQQLVGQLTYPEALQGNRQGRIVVVQFQLTETNRITQLRVFCDNQQLTDELTRQLVKVRIQPTESIEYVARTYTARLHFRQ
jgi:hypothetical protein